MANPLILSSCSGSQSPNPPNELANDAIALAYATTRVERMTKKVDPTMKDLLRYLEVEESERAPMMGWTRRPERGPASQTREVDSFVKPSERRYGVPNLCRFS